MFSRTCPGSSSDIGGVVCNTLMKVQLLPISSDDSASSTVSGTGSEITGPSEVFATDVVSLRVRLYQDLPTIALHTIPISSS